MCHRGGDQHRASPDLPLKDVPLSLPAVLQPVPEAEAERLPCGGRWRAWFVGGWHVALGKLFNPPGPQLLIFEGLSLTTQPPGALRATVARKHGGGPR